jgi:hypothetical protein
VVPRKHLYCASVKASVEPSRYPRRRPIWARR